MIVFPGPNSNDKSTWQDAFVAMLPAIHERIRFSFRGFTAESREEAIAEALASAAIAFKRLHEQGRADIAYPTVLADFAARHYRAGRRVGGRLNVNDISSPHAQRFHRIQVKSIDQRDRDGAWKEILVEDRRSTPAATAIARIDFADWLSRLCHRDRSVASTLAAGENGRDTAKLVGISAGRVTQIRSKLKRSWAKFQGEPIDEVGELAMAGC
jgi:hypothetical protein